MGWEFEAVESRKAIRKNIMNIKGKNLEQRFNSMGFHLQRIPFLETGYWIEKSKISIGATTEYLLGFYSIQEAAAQIPATLFTELKGKTILDACAAPGGKTVQLADLMNNTGTVIALDVRRQRLFALSNHLERCRVANTVVYNLDARCISKLGIQFDKILLDVPCSGNFVTDQKWFEKRTLQDIQRNAKLQREILSEATKCVSIDGELVYSTCSLEPEENEINMDWATKNLNLEIEEIECPGQRGLSSVFGIKLDNSLERSRRLWPSETQGFFVCKLRKRAGGH
ncbi:RsmB/NOP family class I SAM-dependent RNA methyltransferase [Candidatus Bathyarchaeota archaeon]|nr:RsmB/NOP family class I SAM-dependent RNA methyltransferase [Candidatus Bathyarchaeota archaeon]